MVSRIQVKMAKLALIGGTGLNAIKNLKISHRQMVQTPYGEPSSPIIFGKINQREIAFLARHGSGHTIPPHQINYRANLWALKEIGIESIVAVASVGGIAASLAPATIVIPDQLIDYTYSREHTYCAEYNVNHIDFTFPYDDDLRQSLIKAAESAAIELITSGTYAATQGPRLETAAEIRRLAQDSCTMVGMTGMPEAALARELGIAYACCAVVANWAAGINNQSISMVEIEKNLVEGMHKVKRIIEKFTEIA